MTVPLLHGQRYLLPFLLLVIQCVVVVPLSFAKEWNRRQVLTAAGLASPFLRVDSSKATTTTAAAAATKPAPVAPYLMKEYFQEPTTAASYGRFYFPALTPPFRRRATYRHDTGRNTWALEQLLTFANVTATIRTNVVRMKDGALWVHSPQWPTGEYCHLLDELGPVKHIVLPCNAFEHKAPVQAFCEKYPDATVWISPGQYGPLGSCGLDLASCKMGYKVDGVLTADASPPWMDEFDFSTFYVNIKGNAGPVSEVAFYHRPTTTLVATDAVAFIPKGPTAPAIFGTYFDAATVADTTFWPRTVLQSVFLPLRTNNLQGNSYPGFDAINSRLIRAPILRGFTDARAPNETRAWIFDQVCQFKFDRILTSHFGSPIAATSANVRDTFSFLNTGAAAVSPQEPPIACRDWELLNTLNDAIADNKLGAPAVFDYTKGCVDE